MRNTISKKEKNSKNILQNVFNEIRLLRKVSKINLMRIIKTPDFEEHFFIFKIQN